MNIREKLSEIIQEELNPIPDEKRYTTHKFYYQHYQDNLIFEMDEKHRNEYGKGSGGELEGTSRKPAKMASLVSSSAMTFNILGNLTATVKDGQRFSAGQYDISYEKQIYTLNKGSQPANLDAFLVNRSTNEAIFCEMKMLEWLSRPGALKDSYLSPNYYFSPKAYEVFYRIACALLSPGQSNAQSVYDSKFCQYDAWQMFKHTFAIYNATSHTAKDAFNQRMSDASMAGQFKNISLVNVVFEMDETLIRNDGLRSQYMDALDLEHREANEFISWMLMPEYGLVKLFEEDCGVKFDICYLSAHKFVSCFDKTQEEIEKLRRYCCR